MSIHKLPDYVVNRLKAGEVVQRPASLLKELVENSLDAGATEIEIVVNDGGKTYLSVKDNGSGIELSDMDLLLERYATSKISTEDDLFSLESYGFRGEALASIAEVSKISILTKTAYAVIGTKLVRRGAENVIKHMGVPFEHGTLIIVEDLFYNVPARLKFLKSAQTEFYYCYNYFLDVALFHYDKAFVLKKNEKIIFDLKPSENLENRILDLYKKDWGEKIIPFSCEEGTMKLSGVVSDSSLRFGSGENIKVYVNSRPVLDRGIRKSLMDAYSRQLTPGEYPLAILMLDVNPSDVDVNVHPSKNQVKFVDGHSVDSFVFKTVSEVLGKHKIGAVGVEFFKNKNFGGISGGVENVQGFDGWGALDVSHSAANISVNGERGEGLDFSPVIDGIGGSPVTHPVSSNKFVPQPLLSSSSFSSQVSHYGSFDQEEMRDKFFFNDDIGEYQILGQAWNSYIVLQSNDGIYWIDQHALAERIAFEKMKVSQDHAPETLLQPIKFEITQIPNLEEKIEELNGLGFEISMLSDTVVVIYAIPKVFVQYPIDMQSVLNHVLYLETITFDHLLDGIYATKACKISIKAGHKLSYVQMQQLIKDGFEFIPGMFVCQHGRPFFVKMDKGDIDKLFDR